MIQKEEFKISLKFPKKIRIGNKCDKTKKQKKKIIANISMLFNERNDAIKLQMTTV